MKTRRIVGLGIVIVVSWGLPWASARQPDPERVSAFYQGARDGAKKGGARTQDQVDDAAQEAFVSAFEKYPSEFDVTDKRSREQFANLGWVIGRREAINEVRRKNGEQHVENIGRTASYGLFSTSSDVENRELIAKTNAAVGPEVWAAARLHNVEGYSQIKVAGILDTTRSEVRASLNFVAEAGSKLADHAEPLVHVLSKPLLMVAAGLVAVLIGKK